MPQTPELRRALCRTETGSTSSRPVLPGRPHFDELDRYVELELAGQDADAAVRA